MSQKFDAVSIGYVVQDIIMTGIPRDALTRDTIVAAETLITSGGDAANQAVTLARLGSSTGLLVKVGHDTVGDSIYSGLKNEPVDCSLIIRDADAKMMMVVVVIQPNGDRSFLIKRGNDSYYLTPDDISDEVLKNTRAVTVGSFFCLPGLDGNGIAEVLRRARSFDTITVCDMAHDINNIGPAALDCVFPYVDYMMPSLEEASYTTGQTDPDKIADYFLCRGVKNVVLKLGAEGCFFRNGRERFFTDPYIITPVDTTGCGDSFLGAFTHALLKGLPLRDCADFACAAGAVNALGLGAHHTIQSEAHVLSFMRDTPRRSVKR